MDGLSDGKSSRNFFRKSFWKDQTSTPSFIEAKNPLKLSHKLAFKDALDDYDYSVTRLGYFWKVGVINFLTKVAQIFSNFMGYLEKCNFTKISLQFGHF